MPRRLPGSRSLQRATPAAVSTSGYYDWCARHAAGRSERQLDEGRLVELMREIFDASDGNYGVPRMHRELRRGGLVVNVKRVHRLMRRHGMVGRFHRRRVVTTIVGGTAYVIPDLIGRRFAPGTPNTAWCQDITYIATGEGWLYMASVVDLGSRRLLGYSMADHMRTELVTDALPMAIGARRHDVNGVNGVIVHADRGTPVSTRRTSTPASVPTITCGPPSGEPVCVGIAWAEFVPFLAFSPEIRRVVYSTNAIESLNARLRRAVRARGHFPNEHAALKCLYLTIRSLVPTGRGRARWAVRWNLP